ncbi:MAG: SDR family oxidoreductase [Leptolyngbyaceae cyanobacterium CSU_1_3]|nr:SDR family oxidoreductase [Leptolyngbyaceae cyanobacterium CSU_1_3]
MSLENKTVVIIGASSGIGLALTHAIAREGAIVIMCSRSIDKLNHARETILGNVEVIAVDVTQESDVINLFAQIDSLDHLIITAATNELENRERFTELSTDKAQRSFDKFWGHFYAAREAAPKIALGGSITFFSGLSAFKPAKQGMAVLAAVNGAIATLGRSLALELAPIRVNVVAPGVVDTAVWDSLSEAEYNAMIVGMQQSLPARHVGTADDIAQSVLYLMTNPYTTGIVLTVDGGLLLT